VADGGLAGARRITACGGKAKPIWTTEGSWGEVYKKSFRKEADHGFWIPGKGPAWHVWFIGHGTNAEKIAAAAIDGTLPSPGKQKGGTHAKLSKLSI
jgi:hypothetical protein